MFLFTRNCIILCKLHGKFRYIFELTGCALIFQLSNMKLCGPDNSFYYSILLLTLTMGTNGNIMVQSELIILRKYPESKP